MKGIFSSPAAAIVSILRRRVLGRGALVDHQVGVDRLEHEALGRRHLAQAGQVLAAQHSEVRVRQQPSLERPLARPHHVGGEIVVTVLA